MKRLFLIVAALVITAAAHAQIEAPVRWSYAAKKTSATEAIVYLKATIQKDWHIYSQNVKEGGPVKTSFSFTPSKAYAPVGKTTEPKPISKIKLKSAKANAVTGKLEFMVCNNVKCLPPDEVEFSIPLGK
jgi:hypothetical protein